MTQISQNSLIANLLSAIRLCPTDLHSILDLLIKYILEKNSKFFKKKRIKASIAELIYKSKDIFRRATNSVR